MVKCKSSVFDKDAYSRFLICRLFYLIVRDIFLVIFFFGVDIECDVLLAFDFFHFSSHFGVSLILNASSSFFTKIMSLEFKKESFSNSEIMIMNLSCS